MSPGSPGPANNALLPDYGPRRLTVELANVCNLHCSYCLRDEDALYHDPAQFLGVDLFERVVREARDRMGVSHIMFTGGEPTLHRGFGDILRSVAELSLTCSFVTNAWHFERVWPLLSEHRPAVTHVAFSLDGTTREMHDRWRGQGSFERVVRAFTRCWASDFPFHVKVGLRRDTVHDLEHFVLFAARLGAAGVSFSHLLATSPEVENAWALTLDERRGAEREIAALARMFRIPVTIDVGYYNIDPAPPCAPLAGVSGNIDYRGRLTLCCNLSGFRGAAAGEPDVVADLTLTPFADALDQLRHMAVQQDEARRRVLLELEQAAKVPDLSIGSPCAFCLNTLEKNPWSTAVVPMSALRSGR